MKKMRLKIDISWVHFTPGKYGRNQVVMLLYVWCGEWGRDRLKMGQDSWVGVKNYNFTSWFIISVSRLLITGWSSVCGVMGCGIWGLGDGSGRGGKCGRKWWGIELYCQNVRGKL
jgi:hypothetical protein